MKCKECGFENREGASFCIYCGAMFDDTYICPKCGETLSKGTLECPSCKHKINYDSLEPLTKEEETKKTKKESKRPLFEKIFYFATIPVFILSIIFLLNMFIGGEHSYILRRLIFSWNEKAELFNSASLDATKVMLWVNEIVVDIFFLAHFAAFIVSLGFVLTNIYRSLKYRTGFECEKYLSITMCSLLMMEYNAIHYNDNNLGYLPLVIVSYIFILMTAFFFYKTYYSFEKGRKNKLVEKILFSLSFYFLFFLVIYMRTPLFTDFLHYHTSFSTYGYLRETISFVDNIDIWNNMKGEALTLVISSYFSVILYQIMCFLITSLLIYFSFHFAHKSEEKKTFKVPFYAVSSFTLITSFLTFGVLLFSSIYMDKVRFNYEFVYLPVNTFVMIIILIIYFSFVNVSLILTRRNIREEKILLKKSSQKE